ncbi:MAG: lactate utilization protein [Eubacteriales bacterium]|nr:lactate utilization protein [Eubacteriales bacterium]
MTNINEKKRYELYGKYVAERLDKRGFEAYYVDNSEEALEMAKKLIPETAVVSFGGSATAEEIGLVDSLKKSNKVIDRDKAKDQEERTELMRQALLSDVYVCGTNAISEDGQLVNIDGTGNRVAAITFGPKEVIIVAGMNKVTKTLEDAVRRARTIAAPANMMRFANEESTTPCSKTGACFDCNQKDCICNIINITRRSRVEGRIKIILIGENLGF